MLTDRSMVCPGMTLLGNEIDAGASIWSPPVKTRLYAVVQLHVPAFLSRQVFVKATPGPMVAPSGMVTSLTNWMCSHGVGVNVGVFVGVGV